MLNGRMAFFDLLLTTEGRISRGTFWRFYLALLGLSIVSVVLDFALGTWDGDTALGVFSSLVSILLLYPSIVMCIKRFHDRNKSGWTFLLLFVPLVNIWPSIELHYLKGTDGPNRYGDDPLQAAGSHTATAGGVVADEPTGDKRDGVLASTGTGLRYPSRTA